MNFKRITAHYQARSSETDPIKIFGGLTLRGSIENVWEPQARALREWHDSRTLRDVSIEMSTGGGKTLVGVLVAQSLVNETRGCVLYVCPTNQLVEQTAARADELGLSVATYTSSTWAKRDLFDSRAGFCITNYAAVFNGLSIFRRENPVAFVFDDAHVAADAIRGAYTLKIPASHPAFKNVAGIFRNVFLQSQREQTFDLAMQGDPLVLLYVPMFEVIKQRNYLYKVLEDSDVAEEDKFAWAHLKDKLHCCCILISGTRLEITPPVLPLANLPYMRGETRRVYMTATLPLQTEFLRTFGVTPDATITPAGKSGEAQKLFLMVKGAEDDEQRKAAKALIQTKKACIICPSGKAAGKWTPPAKVYETKQGQKGVQEFADSPGAEKLAFAARFDGIDLPGKACRVLVLDGLPQGSTLFRSFQDQSLSIERLKMSNLGIRVTQAIGRIFRSNTDHGAVIVVGHELQRWLRKFEHQALLPELLQRQVQLGFLLLEAVDKGEASFAELLEAVLNGDPGWDEFYANRLKSIETAKLGVGPVELAIYILQEARAFNSLWEGHIERARDEYKAARDMAEADAVMSAWMRHWVGVCSQLLKDESSAFVEFSSAANIKVELGRPRSTGVFQVRQMPLGPQSRAIAALITQRAGDLVARRKHISEWLQYGPETSKCEQALCDLGHLLGFASSRPDKETGTGPDVLWQLDGPKVAVGIEAKTEKTSGEYKKKEEIGQVHDHIRWMEANVAGCELSSCIVGKLFPVSKESNPPDELRVLPLDGFHDLAARTEELYVALSGLTHEDLEARLESSLRDRGLCWPSCWNSLPGKLATDLQSEMLGDSAV